jgi:hypothetical protein
VTQLRLLLQLLLLLLLLRCGDNMMRGMMRRWRKRGGRVTGRGTDDRESRLEVSRSRRRHVVSGIRGGGGRVLASGVAGGGCCRGCRGRGVHRGSKELICLGPVQFEVVGKILKWKIENLWKLENVFQMLLYFLQ